MPQDQNNPAPQQGNPLLAALLGQMSPATAPPTTPMQPVAGAGASPVPQQGAPAPQSPMSGMAPMVQGLMQQSQQAMNAPMGQAVPQGNAIIDALKHPVVAGILKALATAAQSYGWTAMQPSERLERTQMQTQKGEALSRLAETGAYESANVGVRQQNANVNQEKADTGQKAQASLADFREFEKQNMQDNLQLKQDANQWKQEMAAGRLDKAQQMIDQKAGQFEQKISLAQKQFGLEETKTSLMGEGMGIKQGMLDLARTALSQKGTVEGAQTTAKLQQFKIEHPILSQFMDMSDLDQLVGGAGGAGIPGVAPTSPTVAPQASPAPQNKAQAKSKGAPSGVTHVFNPATGAIEPANAAR